MKDKYRKEAASKHICDICRNEYYGYGNNAYPVTDGRCCNDCNWMYVIPARIGATFPRPKQ
jgi:hypothetical protein